MTRAYSVKLLYFDQSVNVTLGTFYKNICYHGTAFDIAYKNKASAKNMLNAIFYTQNGNLRKNVVLLF